MPTDDDLLDFLDGAGKTVEPIAPPGLWHNFGEGLGDSTMKGLASVARGAALVAPAVPELFGTGLTDEGRDWYFRHTVDPLNRIADFWTPDAKDVGSAGQLVNGLVQGLVPLAVGGGNPAPLLLTAATDTPTELVRQGVDAETAVKVGAVNTLATAVGFRVPVLGNGLVTRLATGAGGNLAVGAAAREGVGAVLDDAGRADLAEQYRGGALDAWLDLGMGAAFGALHHATTPAHRDALLTATNAEHFQQATMPGEPVTARAPLQHQQALETAIGQILRGENVNVGDTVALDAFNLRPELHAALAPASAGFEASVERVLRAEGGFVDDPADRGGATNFGISSRAHPGVDVASLTREQAKAIYRRDYWDAIGADRLPADLQGAAFDAAVNQGVGWTREALQQANGDLGAFLKLREARYREIVANDPSQAKFLRGWLNRLGAYRETDDAGRALRERLVSDPEQLMREYAALDDSKGGTVLNTDTARELAPEYLTDRTRSADVHEAASDFVKTLYEAKLAAPTPDGFERVVLFTAGGTGAGKTTAVREAGARFGHPEIVYDTNMNTLASAVEKVEQALAADRDVRIAYVYRDPVEALTGGAITRAQRQAEQFGSGRTVPLEEHARTHEGVRPTMEALAARYADNPRVEVVAIDNSRGKGASRVVDLADLPHVEQDGLRERLSEALEEARTAGLDEALYRGFRAGGRPEAGPGLGAGDGRRAQPRHGEVADGSRSPGADAGTPPADPILAEAQSALAENPDLQVMDADGNVLSAADFLAQGEAARAEAAREAEAIQTVVACALRNPV